MKPEWLWRDDIDDVAPWAEAQELRQHLCVSRLRDGERGEDVRIYKLPPQFAALDEFLIVYRRRIYGEGLVYRVVIRLDAIIKANSPESYAELIFQELGKGLDAMVEEVVRRTHLSPGLLDRVWEAHLREGPRG